MLPRLARKLQFMSEFQCKAHGLLSKVQFMTVFQSQLCSHLLLFFHQIPDWSNLYKYSYEK